MITALILAAVIAAPTTEEPTDPLEYGMWVASIEGGWSIALTTTWAIGARSWDAPYAEGIPGLLVARVLYGTTWSFLVSIEASIAKLLAGDDWAGLSRGELRTDWVVAYDIPATCRNVAPGCGLGLGGFSEIRARMKLDALTLQIAMAGGWVQGRFDDNDDRTIIESTWIQSPLNVRPEFSTRLGPIDLRLAAGPGVYWGMHNAHVHPTRVSQSRLQVPAHEIYVLHSGVGAGGHAEIEVGLYGRVFFEIDATLAAFAASKQEHAILDHLDSGGGDGLVTWRRASAGVGVMLPGVEPIVIWARYWTAALDARNIFEQGHRAFVLRFDIPILIGD